MSDIRNRHAGFSLIELLMVIATIAILASLLQPTVATVRQLSQRTVCASNQSQMMLALLAYVGDNQGVTPPADGGEVAPFPAYDIARAPHLMLMYWDYLPSSCIIPGTVNSWGASKYWNAALTWPNVVSCPSVDPGTPDDQWFYSVRWGTPAGFPDELWVKKVIGGIAYSGGSVVFSSIIPSVPYLAEACTTDPIRTGYWPVPLWGAGWPVPRLTHRNLCNVTYKDGHTAARTADQLVHEDSILSYWSQP